MGDFTAWQVHKVCLRVRDDDDYGFDDAVIAIWRLEWLERRAMAAAFARE